MAFGGAAISESPERRSFLLRLIHRPAPADYEYQGPTAVRLSPDGVCRVMAAVHGHPVLVDMHNHLWPNPTFSGTDDVGARVQYRLLQDLAPGSILVQLVFGPDGSFQARWTAPAHYSGWQPLDAIKVVGPHGVRRLTPWDAPADPTGDRLAEWARGRHVRTLPIIGEPALLDTCRMRVGIVGLGGTGSAFLAQAKFFFRHFALIDHDHVEESNLGRLFGAVSSDAREAVPKVDVARRELRCFDPTIAVEAVMDPFPGATAMEPLKACDVIVAGVDNNLARYALAEFAARHLKILVEMGSGLEMREGRVTAMGCQVRLQAPGGPCLVCLNLPIADLESPEVTREKVRSGYLRGTDLTPGEVVTTNMAAATLALRNLLGLLGGHLPRPVPTYLFYDELQPAVLDLSAHYPQRMDCPICGPGAFSIVAWGDRLPASLVLSDPPAVIAEEVHHAS
jgi:molybdopterin/thiamine biosynthesis adenylyltransferase